MSEIPTYLPASVTVPLVNTLLRKGVSASVLPPAILDIYLQSPAGHWWMARNGRGMVPRLLSHLLGGPLSRYILRAM